jgi:hypothetical protein
MMTPAEAVGTQTAHRLRSVIAVIVIGVLVLLQVYRIAAYSTAQAALSGGTAPS